VKIHPMGAEGRIVRQTGGQTDRHDEASSRFSQICGSAWTQKHLHKLLIFLKKFKVVIHIHQKYNFYLVNRKSSISPIYWHQRKEVQGMKIYVFLNVTSCQLVN